MRPEFFDEDIRVDAEFLDRPRLQRLDAQPLLSARHLVAVDGVGDLAQLVAAFLQADAGGAQRPVPSRLACLLGVTRPGHLIARATHLLACQFGGPFDGLRQGCGLPTSDAARLRPFARGDLRACGGLEGFSAPSDRADSFLKRAKRQTLLGLLLARRRGERRQTVSFGDGRFALTRFGLRLVETHLEFHELFTVRIERDARLLDRVVDAVTLVGGRGDRLMVTRERRHEFLDARVVLGERRRSIVRGVLRGREWLRQGFQGVFCVLLGVGSDLRGVVGAAASG